ncbi:MAG: hypothetical protein ACTSVV_05465 [Promethearchaeota archaeon]
MTKDHNYSFFGKDQALIIITKELNDNVHLNFIRKKNDGTWQSLKEGIHIILNINELCRIAWFLDNNVNSINIIHKHPNSNQIKNFKFEKSFDKRKNKEVLFIKAKMNNNPSYGKFSKPLYDEEIRLFKKIIEHLEMEKIANYKKLEMKIIDNKEK